MNNQPTPSSCVVPPSGSRVIRAYGQELTVHLGSTDTGGKYSVFTDLTPPGGGPPPHYHDDEDEWFFVLAGRVEFFLDKVWAEVPVGTTVFVPKGVVHTFRNPGDQPLRMLIQVAPAGFENFYARSAEEFAKPGPPDMKRLTEISAEHGIHIVEVGLRGVTDTVGEL